MLGCILEIGIDCAKGRLGILCKYLVNSLVSTEATRPGLRLSRVAEICFQACKQGTIFRLNCRKSHRGRQDDVHSQRF